MLRDGGAEAAILRNVVRQRHALEAEVRREHLRIVANATERGDATQRGDSTCETA